MLPFEAKNGITLKSVEFISRSVEGLSRRRRRRGLFCRFMSHEEKYGSTKLIRALAKFYKA